MLFHSAVVTSDAGRLINLRGMVDDEHGDEFFGQFITKPEKVHPSGVVDPANEQQVHIRFQKLDRSYGHCMMRVSYVRRYIKYRDICNV